jgi:amino acid adenylation domain-containing protein
MFQKVATEHPTSVAIASGDRQLTYSQLDAWSNNISNHLLKLGATKGTFVTIAAESSFSVITSMIAVLKIGGVFIPVDPRQPESRLRTLAGQAPPQYVLTERQFQAEIASKLGVDIPVITVDREDPDDHSPCLLPRQTASGLENTSLAPPCNFEPDDMCYIYYTSGSTGKPKAIAGRIKSIDHFVRWETETFGVTPGTVVSQLTSPIFDAFLRDTFTPLCAGGTLRVPDNRETILDPKRLRQWIHESGIGLIHSVPSLFRSLLSADLTPELFPSLRYVLLSGEPLLPSDVKRWTDVFGDRIPLVNLYGPTETTMIKLFYITHPEDAGRRSVPIGQAISGTRAVVVDEAGRPAAEGMIGEIYIRTPYRTLGYYGDPELTDQVFVRNPLSQDPTDIVYRTGDLGRLLEDGNIEFLGRKDQQVKVRGIRVELEEIESVIHATGMVQEAAVTSRGDRLGNAYLCAYLVLSPGATVEQIREKVAAALPEYLVPAAVAVLEKLPRTPTGKIDRKSLPGPDEIRSQGSGQPRAPQSELEVEVAKVFASVLGIESVGVDEDFFQLGGHSLLAMNLLSQLSAQFEVELPLAILFDKPTVEQMAADIEERLRQPDSVSQAAPGMDFTAAVGADAADRIKQLSDDEVDTLLADFLTKTQ